jgi:hypothetical protein
MVTAVFRDGVNAQSAYDRLLDRGYTSTEVNVIMSDQARSSYFPTERPAPRIMASNAAAEGLGVGGAIGTAVGATLAAVMAVGTSLPIPGLGVVIAGPLAGALAGAGAGAVTGGLLGGLIGLGIPEPNARAYQEVLRDGGGVLGVVPHGAADADAIRQDFDDLRGENVCYC